MLIIDDVATTAAFTCFNTKGKKERPHTINVNNFWSYSTFLIAHRNTTSISINNLL